MRYIWLAWTSFRFIYSICGNFLIHFKSPLSIFIKMLSQNDKYARPKSFFIILIEKGLRFKMDGTVSQRCISKFNIEVRIYISAIQ